MPNTRFSIYASAVSALLLSAPLSAQATCLWTDLVKEGTTVARIRPDTARVPFLQDIEQAPGCPDGDTTCRSGIYARPGDMVLTGATHNGFTCAGYGDLRGFQMISWLPNAALAPLPEAERAPSDWTGHWVGEQAITITPGKDGSLLVEGAGTWGRDHIGEVSGEARPVDGVLAFAMDGDQTVAYDKGDEDDCRIKMWRRGPYLLVRDNKQCGGVNVSFSGFYRRMP